MRATPRSMDALSFAEPVYLRYGTAACMYLPQNSVCHQPCRSVFSRNGAVI